MKPGWKTAELDKRELSCDGDERNEETRKGRSEKVKGL